MKREGEREMLNRYDEQKELIKRKKERKMSQYNKEFRIMLDPTCGSPATTTPFLTYILFQHNGGKFT